jgi:hypothetical protein
MNVKLNLIRVNKCLGLNFYSGSIRLEDLFENYQVPIYKAGTADITAKESGYQRIPKQKRVDDIRNRVMNVIRADEKVNTEAFVDYVNLNIRTTMAEKLISPLIKGKDDYGDVFEFDFNSEDVDKFVVVDGQTRIKGAHAAYREALVNGDLELVGQLGSTRLQFTLTFCDDIFLEAYVFYLINQYAKAIPPEGAIRLLHEGKEKGNIHFANEVTTGNKVDMVESMKVAQWLYDHSEVWAGNIADFNDSGSSKINIQALTRIIVPIHKIIKKAEGRESISPEETTASVVEAFWCGVQMAYPEMFSDDKKADFNILKAASAEVMMMILVEMYQLNQTRTFGLMTDKKAFKEKIKTLLDAVEERNLGDTAKVKGSAIFIVGKEGVIGKYGNASSKKQFVQKVRTIFLEQIYISVE